MAHAHPPHTPDPHTREERTKLVQRLAEHDEAVAAYKGDHAGLQDLKLAAVADAERLGAAW